MKMFLRATYAGLPRLAQCFSFGLLTLAIACGGEEQAEEAPVARPVRMFTLGSGGVSEGTLEYPGVLSTTQSAELAFEVPGRIVEFPVDEGQDVQQGQVLASLDARDYEASRDAAAASMNAAKAEYDRYRDLYASNAVSQQELEIKRRNYELSEARNRTAEKALADTGLRAPFSGVVARKLVEDFENVQAKQSVLVLQDESGMEVTINVPERDFVLARPGLTLEERTARTNPHVELSSLPGRSFPAALTEFATAADPVTRTYALTLAFDPPSDVAVRSGMTARVIVTVPADMAGEVAVFAVPADAVIADEGGNPLVWLVDEASMTVSRAPVVLGELSGTDVEIVSGLASGDVIAVSGVHNLRDGMLVRRLEN
jgi:RND family efflux transporter MFP subunit